jgi:hypothetical protein
MKKHFTFLILFCLSFTIKVQSQNALDFDGIDDQVQIFNASSFINSGTGISFGLWVYPRNAAPNFPNFDGFGGFRNDADADFYLVQIGPTDVEARFRNSNGTYFDITFNGLLLNTWQHLLFTYDGVNTKLYHNGIEVGSQNANGSISNASQTLYLGNIVYSFNDFLIDGKIDDVVLFNKALSLPEITCLQHGDVDTTDVSLGLYYNCNQGVAGGINSGINTLNSFNGQNIGTLNNFTLSGNSSNWVEGDYFAATETANICIGESYTYNGIVYSTPGVYSFYFPLTNGCDSVSHFVLNNLIVDTALFANNSVLTALGNATAFQWVQCDNNYAPIAGATQSSYTVTANGDYAVLIYNGNCVDTSRCVTITAVNIEGSENLNKLTLWPSPVNQTLFVKASNRMYSNFIIYDETGRVLKQENNTGKNDFYPIDVSEIESGIYFLSFTDDQGNGQISKFVVMH